MKKILLILGCFLLFGCTNNGFQIQKLEEYKYVESHPTDNVIVKNDGLAGEICMKIEYEDAMRYLDSIKIKKAVDISVTDSDSYYIFIYENTVKSFYFQGGYFNYNNQNYEIKLSNNAFSLEEVDCNNYLK